MDGVVEAASAQKSFIALLFIAVTEFLCFLYLDQFKSVGTRRNFLYVLHVSNLIQNFSNYY